MIVVVVIIVNVIIVVLVTIIVIVASVLVVAINSDANSRHQRQISVLLDPVLFFTHFHFAMRKDCLSTEETTETFHDELYKYSCVRFQFRLHSLGIHAA